MRGLCIALARVLSYLDTSARLRVLLHPDLSVHRTRLAEAAARKMMTTTTTTRRPFKVPEMALRVCVIPLALASLWEMATNKQADDTYGEISFSNLSGFKSACTTLAPFCF